MMWKKEEGVPGQAPVEAARTASVERPTGKVAARATIGASIGIVGDVTGSEDLLVEGEIKGSLKLAKHAVTVGSEGRVHADITGRVIVVDGRVEGDLTADEQVVLRGTARVQGDIKAPRVVLEDGATFRGLVDMGSKSDPDGVSESTSKSESGSAESGSAESEPVDGAPAKVGQKGTAEVDRKADANRSPRGASRTSSGKEGATATGGA